jgi:hypothetical protein
MASAMRSAGVQVPRSPLAIRSTRPYGRGRKTNMAPGRMPRRKSSVCSDDTEVPTTSSDVTSSVARGITCS